MSKWNPNKTAPNTRKDKTVIQHNTQRNVLQQRTSHTDPNPPPVECYQPSRTQVQAPVAMEMEDTK